MFIQHGSSVLSKCFILGKVLLFLFFFFLGQDHLLLSSPFLWVLHKSFVCDPGPQVLNGQSLCY